MPKIPVQIGELRFASKGEAEEHFRQMLRRHPIGSRIPAPDATELSWLLERHPEVGDKVGIGVDYFSVRDAVFGTRCFEVVRTDGVATDFSFGSCVNGKAPAPLAEAISALRAEVTEDILKKKRDWFRENGDAEGKVACAITGTRICLDEAHADHAPPRTFGTLAIAFLAARGLEPGPELITPPADNQYRPFLRDRVLAEAWRKYHHELAVIRVVAKGANLARGHEGKVKKKDKQIRLT
jgi:hypothetical protein